MLKATAYCLLENGKLVYKEKNIILYYDDMDYEIEDILASLRPVNNHAEGQCHDYQLELTPFY